MLEIEQSMLQDHEHEDGGHTHSCTASSTSEPHGHNTHWRLGNSYGTNGWTVAGDVDGESTNYDHIYEKTVSVSTTCSLASQTSNLGSVVTENSNAGHETRPANMKILYIMRVF